MLSLLPEKWLAKKLPIKIPTMTPSDMNSGTNRFLLCLIIVYDIMRVSGFYGMY